ncbi:MAG: hypothetical protein ABWY78_23750 [Microvirga sp.]
MNPKSACRIGQTLILPLMICAAIAGLGSPAAAEVRLGPNVRVGGHDFSHQTYGPKSRAVINLYDHKPRNEGCVWRPDGRGGRVKICHLRQIDRRD